MAVITITLPQEIKNRLDEEKNKSGLIASLLNDYFKYDMDSIEVLKQKKIDEEKRFEKAINDINELIIEKECIIAEEKERIEAKERIIEMQKRYCNEDKQIDEILK